MQQGVQMNEWEIALISFTMISKGAPFQYFMVENRFFDFLVSYQVFYGLRTLDGDGSKHNFTRSQHRDQQPGTITN